jgi:polysaccharide export outer membrane protein
MAKAVLQRPGKVAKLILSLLLISAAGKISTAQIQLPSSGISGLPVNANMLLAYRLGVGDEFSVTASHTDDLNNKIFRVSLTGDVNFPDKVGTIHVAGMTLEEVQASITKRLSETIKRPEVSLNITQYRSQPVSVLGEVNRPQTIQLEGNKTLFEVMAMVGGPKPEASRIIIRRRLDVGSIPLSSAVVDGDYSVAEISVQSVTYLNRPQDNILIMANDVITVPRAEVVYVIGEVKKPGGFALIEKRNITILELLVKAEGALPNAAKKNAKVIRQVAGANNIEIPVNLNDVMNSKTNITLQPEDILYVPDSLAKSTAKKTLDTIIQMSLGAAIYHY